MNDDIKNFLSSYRGMIDMYKPKVSPDSVGLKDAEEYLMKMSDLGERCSDISEYLGKVSELDMLNKFSALLSSLASESLKAQQSSGEMKVPSVQDAALGYHKAYESIQDKAAQPETCRVYERVFELEKESSHAGEFVRKMAEEKLFVKMASVPLVEKFRPLVSHADSLSIPVMAFHNECMLKMAEAASSATEIEYESNRLLELNRMELMADELLCNDLFYTLGGAISGWLLSPTEENRQRVENSYRFVAGFFGVNSVGLYEIPRVVDLIEKIIIPMLNKNEEGKKFTVEGFIVEQKGAIDACMKGKDPLKTGSASMKNAVLWGREIPLENMLSAFRNPGRLAEYSR